MIILICIRKAILFENAQEAKAKIGRGCNDEAANEEILSQGLIFLSHIRS